MNEQTLNKPLSGAEIIEVVCNQVKKAMQRDCTLAPHCAYPAFSYAISINITFQDTGTKVKGTSVTVSDKLGELEPEVEVQTAETIVEGAPDSPNTVRMENDMGIPVLTRTPQGGVEEKRIKYSNPKFAEQGRKGK